MITFTDYVESMLQWFSFGLVEHATSLGGWVQAANVGSAKRIVGQALTRSFPYCEKKYLGIELSIQPQYDFHKHLRDETSDKIIWDIENSDISIYDLSPDEEDEHRKWVIKWFHVNHNLNY